MDLYRSHTGIKTSGTAMSFAYGSQNFHQIIIFLFSRRVLTDGGQIHTMGRVIQQSPEPFSITLHQQEILFHIGMACDGDLFTTLPAKSRPLFPLAGKIQGVQISGTAHGITLQTHNNALFIHHIKHGHDTLAPLPDEFGNTLAIITEGQGTGGRTLHARLRLNAGADYIIAFPQ